MNKLLIFVGIFTLISISSCKTVKNTNTEIKSISTKKILKAYQKATFRHNTVQAKIKMHYEDAKTSQSLAIKLRLKKDQVIWMSGSYLGFPVAKVKITPTSVKYYEKINKTYFDGDFRLINDALGVDLNFNQLQNIFFGQAVSDLKTSKYDKEINQQAYLITPKNQSEIFAIFYWINPQLFKLDKQEVKDFDSNRTLTVAYPEYHKISGDFFPKKMTIIALADKASTRINMDFRSVEFNRKLSFPFSIPQGYNEISINDF